MAPIIAAVSPLNRSGATFAMTAVTSADGNETVPQSGTLTLIALSASLNALISRAATAGMTAWKRWVMARPSSWVNDHLLGNGNPCTVGLNTRVGTPTPGCIVSVAETDPVWSPSADDHPTEIGTF